MQSESGDMERSREEKAVGEFLSSCFPSRLPSRLNCKKKHFQTAF